MFKNLPPYTKHLILANVFIWSISLLLRTIAGIDLNYILGLHYFAAQKFHFWQQFTYMFLHDNSGFAHVFFNMFALLMFGVMLERVWGGKRFLFYYLFTGLGAGLIQQLTWYYELVQYPDYQIALAQGYLNNFITVGASGAVFGILLAFAVIFPNVPMYLFFIPIPIKAKYLMIGYAFIELFLGVRSASGMGDGIAHFAHLGGIFFGAILLFYWYKKYGLERYD